MLDEDAHTNLTLSSAISRHRTVSDKDSRLQLLMLQEGEGSFCLRYSMVKGDSMYRSLPEGKEGFGALAQTKTSTPNTSFKCDPHFSTAQSELELQISALQ